MLMLLPVLPGQKELAVVPDPQNPARRGSLVGQSSCSRNTARQFAIFPNWRDALDAPEAMCAATVSPEADVVHSTKAAWPSSVEVADMPNDWPPLVPQPNRNSHMLLNETAPPEVLEEPDAVKNSSFTVRHVG